jgi:hypothetical protein
MSRVVLAQQMEKLLLVRAGRKLSWMLGEFIFCVSCSGTGVDIPEQRYINPADTAVTGMAYTAYKECPSCHGRQGQWLFVPLPGIYDDEALREYCPVPQR